MITVIAPDRVVIVGGVAAAGELILPLPGRDPAAGPDDRVGEVDLVIAELGPGPGRSARRSRGGAGGRRRRSFRDRARVRPAPPPDRAVLRERITALRPGDRLPSDAELCAQFGVSRMTARNAMQRLVEEGLIARHPGRGSFVAVPTAHRHADRLMTFSREMARRGRTPSSRLLTRTVRPSTARGRCVELAVGGRRRDPTNDLPIETIALSGDLVGGIATR